MKSQLPLYLVIAPADMIGDEVMFGSCDGLVLSWWQAMAWTNDDTNMMPYDITALL